MNNNLVISIPKQNIISPIGISKIPKKFDFIDNKYKRNDKKNSKFYVCLCFLIIFGLFFLLIHLLNMFDLL